MLQRLTGSPRYTFSKEALWSLGSLGMVKSFNSVQVAKTAAMVRMTLQTATVFSKMKALFDSSFNDDDCMMQSFASGEVALFDTPAIVNTLQKTIDSAFLPDIQQTSWRLNLQSMRGAIENAKFQNAIFAYLGTVSLDFDAGVFLSRRMHRWQHEVSDIGKAWWDFSGPFIVQLCRYELLGAAPCVIAAYLKTVLNGWASARRLGLPMRQCVFGCGSKQDSIEHYIGCCNVEAIWKRINGSDWGPFECRLAVGCAEVHDRIARTFFLYGIYSAYNQMRHGHT